MCGQWLRMNSHNETSYNMAKSHLIGTFGLIVSTLTAKKEGVEASILAEKERIVTTHNEAFYSLGGCKLCKGEGSYESWFNGDDYRSWGACAQCKDSSGQWLEPQPSKETRPIESRNVVDDMSTTLLRLIRELDGVEIALVDARANNKPCVGLRVRVTQGRGRCKAGLEGIVEYIKDASTILFMTDNGEKIWCDPYYTSVVIETQEAINERTIARACAKAEKEKAQAVFVDTVTEKLCLPTLIGSEKQVAWAMSIRAQMLSVVGITEEHFNKAVLVTSAKRWIDARNADIQTVIGEYSANESAKAWLSDQATMQPHWSNGSAKHRRW
jgi:hypothetical protein